MNRPAAARAAFAVFWLAPGVTGGAEVIEGPALVAVFLFTSAPVRRTPDWLLRIWRLRHLWGRVLPV
jgi:hypothetical protein